MDSFLYSLAQDISLHELSTVVIMIGFLATLFRSYAASSRDVTKYHKFCGALIVFLIAMNVDKDWYYAISILVGGLVVASESFMLKLLSHLRFSQKRVEATTAEVLRVIEHASSRVTTPVTLEENPKVNQPSDVPTKQ